MAKAPRMEHPYCSLAPASLRGYRTCWWCGCIELVICGGSTRSRWSEVPCGVADEALHVTLRKRATHLSSIKERNSDTERTKYSRKTAQTACASSLVSKVPISSGTASKLSPAGENATQDDTVEATQRSTLRNSTLRIPNASANPSRTSQLIIGSDRRGKSVQAGDITQL